MNSLSLQPRFGIQLSTPKALSTPVSEKITKAIAETPELKKRLNGKADGITLEITEEPWPTAQSETTGVTFKVANGTNKERVTATIPTVELIKKAGVQLATIIGALLDRATS